MSYQGYANQATWTVCLHIDQNQQLQEAAYALAAVMPNKEDRNDLADRLKELVTQLIDGWVFQGQTPMQLFHRDVFHCALNSVDWHEVADHYRDIVL